MKKQTRSAERTKCVLVEASKKLFARCGFHGVNIRDIAKDAGVNISLISYYFGGKEGLYRQCLQNFGESRMAQLEKVLVPAKTKEEFALRVELALEELLNFHMNDPETLQILFRDISSQTELLDKNVMKTLTRFVLGLAEYFADAKEKKFLKSETEPMMLAALLYFTFTSWIQFDSITSKTLGLSLKDDEFRKNVIQQMLAIVFKGALA